ncbi:MAG: DUF551 domain-containing protein [Zoogloea sp.]|uniref:DUF551 domain-containing protein n=1 Tax=Zoogloea sp. TaxID=49181 RepID=UPI00260EC77D|nr:DUF551 domain-containing protein [Zoogloea sp.]MDD3328321.1 DUF551 domain-containing protein [Zoogloea sp.]
MSSQCIDTQEREEAKRLAEELMALASALKHVFRKTDGMKKIRRDIKSAAALLDSYQAGLVLTAPHPAMCAELVLWVSVDDALPDADETVLICGPGDDSPWPGYLDSPHWRSADGLYLNPHRVTHWAKMPAGPAATGVVTPSDNSPEAAQ